MQYEILEDEFVGTRIDKYLNEINEDYTRSFVQKMIEEGNVTVNGKPVKASYKLKMKDVIEVEEIENTEIEAVAEDIPIDIVYEDEFKKFYLEYLLMVIWKIIIIKFLRM